MTCQEFFLFLPRRVVAIVASLGSARPVRPDALETPAPRSFVTAIIAGKVAVRVVAVATLLVVGHPFVTQAQSCWDKCHAVGMAVYDGDDDNLDAATRAFHECLAQFCQA